MVPNGASTPRLRTIALESRISYQQGYPSFNHLGHDVTDEGNVIHTFDGSMKADLQTEKAKNFTENLIYNQKVPTFTHWVSKNHIWPCGCTRVYLRIMIFAKLVHLLLSY
jgi:hypothetical protein